MAYKEQKFVAHSSGGWEVQEQGTGRFRAWLEPTFGFTDDTF